MEESAFRKAANGTVARVGVKHEFPEHRLMEPALGLDDGVTSGVLGLRQDDLASLHLTRDDLRRQCLGIPSVTNTGEIAW